MADPLPVPRSVALRLASAVLLGEAARLRALGRKGTRAEGRGRAAAKLEADAARLAGMSGDAALCRGAGPDAAVLGYLLAWLVSWGEARGQLRAEMAEQGLAVPPLSMADLPGGVRAVVCAAA